MIDFLTSTWGIILMIHLIGWVTFQPYIVRSIDRNVLPNCPEGNSLDYCKQYHPVDCRFKNGIRKNVDPGAFWGGTLLALIWEPATLLFFFTKRASAPDAVQKEYYANRDRVALEELERYQKRIAEIEANKGRELTAGGSSVSDPDEKVYTPIPLKDVHARVKMEQIRSASDYNYRKPAWMRD